MTDISVKQTSIESEDLVVIGNWDFQAAPKFSTTGLAGQILFTDLLGNKKITGDNNFRYTGNALFFSCSTGYFKLIDTEADPCSETVMNVSRSGTNAVGAIYNSAYVGTSTLDIDAKPFSVAFASVMRFGYNTVASATSFVFHNGKASYAAHPTFSADTEIVDKKYADDIVFWNRTLIGGSDYRIIPKNTADVINVPTATVSSLIGVDANKDIVTITALPDGTTATTQAASDNSTKVATTAYVDTAVGGENLWNRTDLGGGSFVLTPVTATDAIQVPTSGTAGQILYTDLSGNKRITGSDNLLWVAPEGLHLTNAGAAGYELNLLQLTNTCAGNINTSTSIFFFQKPSSGGTTPLYSASIAAKTTNTWVAGTATTIDSQLEFYVTKDNIKTHVFDATATGLEIMLAGTLKATSNFLTLTNTATAADNDTTGTGMYVKNAGSDGNLYSCGKIYWANEGDWTSTATDRNSSLYFQVAVNAVLTTKVVVGSADTDLACALGSHLYIGSTGAPFNREFAFWMDIAAAAVAMEIDSKDADFQSVIRFKKAGTTAWSLVSRHQVDDPYNRFAIYNGTSTQVVYLYNGKYTWFHNYYDTAPTTTHMTADENWGLWMDSSHVLHFSYRSGGAVTNKTITVT